jgi:hypothetical protein
MKASRNYKLGTPPSGSDMVTLTITLANATDPTTSFAPMKYNKSSGVMMVKDDGGLEDYTIGYAYLKGGFPAKDGMSYLGVYFSDGAGRLLPYKLTSAVNTNKDVNNPAFGLNTWENRKTMLDEAGWELANHSYDHGYFDRYRDIKLAEQIIWDNTGMRTRALVVPTNDEGYTTTALSLGYTIIGTQGAFDDFIDHRQSPDRHGIYWGGVVDTRTFNYKQLLFNRYYAGEGGPSDLADMYTLVNSALQAAKDGTANNMVHWFHHGLDDAGGNGSFEHWKSLIQHIKNHPDNNDSMWITGMQEFTEYYETKDLAIKSERMQGNVMTITLDLSGVPQENRLRDMSLLFTGGSLQSVEVEGANSYTFNPETGLINLYIQNAFVKNPYSDIVPPRLVSAIRSGNSVLLTYDRPITQSISAGYSVEGNTVLSITGSGTAWSINCQNQLQENTTFSYRLQRGDAAGLDGVKVCSYIGYPIGD